MLVSSVSWTRSSRVTVIAIAKQRKITGPPCPRACTKKHTKKNRPSSASSWIGWLPKMPLITMKACPTTSTSPTNATAFDNGKGPAPRIRNCTARTGPKKGMTSPVARINVNPAATASATRSPMRRWRDRATEIGAENQELHREDRPKEGYDLARGEVQRESGSDRERDPQPDAALA